MMSGTYRYPSFLSIHIIPQVLTFRSFIHFLNCRSSQKKKEQINSTLFSIHNYLLFSLTIFLLNICSNELRSKKTQISYSYVNY